MATIIDLGNGYGQLRGYPSEHASLTFPLNVSTLRGLHIDGYLSDIELWDILARMGFGSSYIKWVIAVDNVQWEQLKERLLNARTI